MGPHTVLSSHIEGKSQQTMIAVLSSHMERERKHSAIKSHIGRERGNRQWDQWQCYQVTWRDKEATDNGTIDSTIKSPGGIERQQTMESLTVLPSHMEGERQQTMGPLTVLPSQMEGEATENETTDSAIKSGGGRERQQTMGPRTS